MLRAKKGVTYQGAEFTNLSFEIIKDKLSNLNRLKNWRPGKSKISDIVKVIKK